MFNELRGLGLDANGLYTILILVIKVIILVVPVKLAAMWMAAKRTGFLWCALALLISAILYQVGEMLVPTYGTIVAFLLASAGFTLILGTSYAGGIGVSLLYLLFSLLISYAARVWLAA